MDKFKGIVGCGMACALTASALGADAAFQWTLVAFGGVYGGLWIEHG